MALGERPGIGRWIATQRRKASSFYDLSAAVIREEGVAFWLLDLYSFVLVRNAASRWLMMKHLVFARSLFSVYATTTRLYYRLLRIASRHEITDADPYKTIVVDPDSIECELEYGEDGPRITKRFGRVLGGDWDTMTRPLEEKLKYREWKRFDQSPYLDDEEPITKLYFEIEDEGFKSQREVLRTDLERAVRTSGGAIHPLLNDIGVNIGRNGELIWRCYGQHRIILAKILGIDEVPVKVLVRHAEWQELRSKIKSRGDVPPEFADHPDLQNLG